MAVAVPDRTSPGGDRMTGRDGQARLDVTYRPARPDLGDPTQDPPLVVRVHPGDDPYSPAARRVIRITGTGRWVWLQVTGTGRLGTYQHRDVADWPVQHPIIYAATFRHASRGER